MVSMRRRRGIALLIGAVVLALVVQPVGSAAFYWVPLVSGLTYLLAAASGGRRGALWAPGLMLSFWGAAVVLVLGGTTHVDFASAAVTGLGAGAVAAVALSRVGFAVDAFGIAATVLLAGAFELLDATGPAAFGKGWLYGGLLGLWGLWELRSERPVRQ